MCFVSDLRDKTLIFVISFIDTRLGVRPLGEPAWKNRLFMLKDVIGDCNIEEKKT